MPGATRCITPRLGCSCRQVSAQPISPHVCVRSAAAKKSISTPQKATPVLRCALRHLLPPCSPRIPGGKQQPGARQLPARRCLSARLRVWLTGRSESVSASPPAAARSLHTARGRQLPALLAGSVVPVEERGPQPCTLSSPHEHSPVPPALRPCRVQPLLPADGRTRAPPREDTGTSPPPAGRWVSAGGLMAALFSLAAVNMALWQPPPFLSPGRPFFLLSII